MAVNYEDNWGKGKSLLVVGKFTVKSPYVWDSRRLWGIRGSLLGSSKPSLTRLF